MIEKLNLLIETDDNYKYLSEPILTLLKDLDKNITFNKNVINSTTIKNLRAKRADVKIRIEKYDYKFKRFKTEEKTKMVTIVEEHLKESTGDNTHKIELLRSEIRDLKAKIKELENSDDESKIIKLSDFITVLYKTAVNVSDIVQQDINLDSDSFRLEYLKRGNLIQPVLTDDKNSKKENIYTGSMARHTLMQLCAYLGFLYLLLDDDRYPIIPMLVIDHISQPFDPGNKKSIGAILEKFFEIALIEDIQIFMFDDSTCKDVGLSKAKEEYLFNKNKTGFNPYYFYYDEK